jgi:hypothetical protein
MIPETSNGDTVPSLTGNAINVEHAVSWQHDNTALLKISTPLTDMALSLI